MLSRLQGDILLRVPINYRSMAKAKWPGVTVLGDGPFAVISRCRNLRVTLCDRKELAAELKRRMDADRCGMPCWGQHETGELTGV